jgi:hypothetical protein
VGPPARCELAGHPPFRATDDGAAGGGPVPWTGPRKPSTAKAPTSTTAPGRRMRGWCGRSDHRAGRGGPATRVVCQATPPARRIRGVQRHDQAKLRRIAVEALPVEIGDAMTADRPLHTWSTPSRKASTWHAQPHPSHSGTTARHRLLIGTDSAGPWRRSRLAPRRISAILVTGLTRGTGPGLAWLDPGPARPPIRT